MLEAGKLNRRITVLKKQLGASQNGYRAETWVQHGPARWAEMITTGGRELYAAQKVTPETTAVFRMRFTNAINTSMRLQLGNRVFDILPPVNDVDGKRVELLISAKEIDPGK